MRCHCGQQVLPVNTGLSLSGLVDLTTKVIARKPSCHSAVLIYKESAWFCCIINYGVKIEFVLTPTLMMLSS
jgi:hypothetical protein